MRIPAWRGLLLGGLFAAVVYFLLSDTERVASASSAVLHFAAAVAVVVLLAADTGYGVVSLQGPFRPGSSIDIGFIMFPLCCGAAALHPSMAEGHFGLAGMRERASLAGGAMEVSSLPGHGTTVEVRLPLTATQAAVAHSS